MHGSNGCLITLPLRIHAVLRNCILIVMNGGFYFMLSGYFSYEYAGMLSIDPTLAKLRMRSILGEGFREIFHCCRNQGVTPIVTVCKGLEFYFILVFLPLNNFYEDEHDLESNLIRSSAMDSADWCLKRTVCAKSSSVSFLPCSKVRRGRGSKLGSRPTTTAWKHFSAPLPFSRRMARWCRPRRHFGAAGRVLLRVSRGCRLGEVGLRS
jgi:hypothetical protein